MENTDGGWEVLAIQRGRTGQSQWEMFAEIWQIKERHAKREVPSAVLYVKVVQLYLQDCFPIIDPRKARHYNHNNTHNNEDKARRLKEFLDLLHRKAALEEDGGEGDNNAQCVLGKMYADGLITSDTNHNNKQAFHYYSLAAYHPKPQQPQPQQPQQQPQQQAQHNCDPLEGHVVGLGLLAEVYDQGNMVPRNISEAKKLFEEAAAKGNAASLTNLGYLYEVGDGVEQDYQNAARYYRLGAEAGNTGGLRNLAGLYERGLGVEKNTAEAFRLCEIAADRGDPVAQFNLGVWLDSGTHGIKDERRAARYYTDSANQGYVEAQFNLALMYDSGRGVSKDPKKAFELYRMGAESGDSDSQCELGLRYADGAQKGTEGGGGGGSVSGESDSDWRKALEWIHRAALKKHVRGSMYLARWYEEGIEGVLGQDVARGHALYRQAAQSDSRAARFWLARNPYPNYQPAPFGE